MEYTGRLQGALALALPLPHLLGGIPLVIQTLPVIISLEIPTSGPFPGWTISGT